jgi:hypothetical protein
MPRPCAGLLPLAVAALVACGDSNGLGDAIAVNELDTLTLFALEGTPITTPSAFSIIGVAVRTDATTEFEFAFNRLADGRAVFLPRAVLGLPSASGADPGLQPRPESFDAIEEAPSDGYVTDDTVAVAVGERYVVRSRVVCASLGVPQYGKLEILALEDRAVTFRALVNNNCGYRGLLPGLPEE